MFFYWKNKCPSFNKISKEEREQSVENITMLTVCKILLLSERIEITFS